MYTVSGVTHIRRSELNKQKMHIPVDDKERSLVY